MPSRTLGFTRGERCPPRGEAGIVHSYLNHSLLKRCRVIVNLPSRASACGPRGGRRRASIAMAGLLARLRECSLLCTRDNHPDRGSPSLWPERCPTLIFKNKAAAWTYGKRVEDTFVSLTCNRTDLAAFSIDEANDRSSWEPRRIRRARSLGTRWSQEERSFASSMENAARSVRL